MKRNYKRGVSILLVLVLLISLLAGLILPAHAADYVYNWGYRGNTATSLSSYASAFYSGNGTSYETLAILQGSADVGSVPSSALYGQLRALMAGSHSHITDYAETKDYFQYTDCQGGGGAVSSFYSGIAVGPEWDNGGTWNREHTWPNSKGMEGDDENDIMMLRPTASMENSARGNKAYGISSGYYNPNSVSNGAYNLHGDVARIALYVYVRWGNTGKMWGSDGVIESKDVLLTWMQEDPVDTWELGRNDAVQSITGTRNVFVDYPELAFLLFGEEIPTTMVTPSGKAGQTHEITATVNDAAMGTVSLSGNNINAVPAEGYMVEGYEVVSGSANVSRNGNAFTVSALSDCTIQINFAPRPLATVSYGNDGTVLATDTVYSGDTITLPQYTGTAPEGYTFLGWSDADVFHSEDLPGYYLPEASYTVNGNTTLHALFSYVTTGSSDSSVWMLVTDASQLEEGAKVVIAAASKNLALSTTQNGNNRGQAEITKNADNTITLTESAAQLVLGKGTKDNTWSFYCDANSGYLYAASSSKNYLRTQKTLNDNGSFSITVNPNGISAVVAQGNNTRNQLRYNPGSSIFSCYSNGQEDVSLYIETASGTTTIYTTASCLHENTREVPAETGSCTADGYTAGIFCSDCNSYISGHELIPAPGHNYGSVVTPPTADTDGYTTYTCAACGNSYVGDTVPALGQTYTVSFSVPEDVPGLEDMTCNNSGITLPVAEVPADAKDTYSFLGWTTAPLDESTEMPEYFEGGASYVAPADITLYALYTCTQGGTGESAYVLVEDVSQLTAGSKIVIASAPEEFALSTTQNGNNRGQAEITKNDDKTITLGDGVAELVLGEGTKEGTWSFYCAVKEGYLYAASSSSNYLRTQKTLDDNGSFAIQLGENGEATVTAQGSNTRNLLRHNKTNKIFSCYGSGQQAVSFYIETMDGTVTYTTNISHVHKGVYQQAVPATCTSSGTVAHYACDCGMNFADEACTIPLTTISVPQTAHAYTAETAEEDYLKSAANCAGAAVYYLSCEHCGLSSKGTAWETTFASGEADPDVHTGETYLSGKKDATCAAPGYTGDTHCSGCREKLITGQTVPGGHKLSKVEAVAATHTQDGVVSHYACSVCKKLFTNSQTTQELTAAEVVIPKLGHSYGNYKTDEDNHWKECSCGDVTGKGAHTFGSWKTVKKAEQNVEGRKERSCTVCGYTESKTIPAASSPATGDVLIVLVLGIMIASCCGVFVLTAVRAPKGKYLR